MLYKYPSIALNEPVHNGAFGGNKRSVGSSQRNYRIGFCVFIRP